MSSDGNLVSLANMVVSLTLSGTLGFLVTVAPGFPKVAGIFLGQATELSCKIPQPTESRPKTQAKLM